MGSEIQAADRGGSEMQDLQEAYTQKLQKLRVENLEKLKAESQAGEAAINHLRERTSETLERTKNEGERQLTYERNTLTKRAQSALDHGKARLESLNESNQRQIDEERDSFLSQEASLKTRLQQEIAEKQKYTADDKVQMQKEIEARQLSELTLKQKQEIQKLTRDHENEVNSTVEDQKKQLQQSQMDSKAALLKQQKKFIETFNKNQLLSEEQVRGQRQMLLENLAFEKRKALEKADRYSTLSKDPFYRATQPSATLSETDDHYMVSVEVPEYEKENVKVTVHGNSVIVHGERQFEDEFEDEGTRSATHNYQTYRQVFPLDHPVREKYVQSHYDNGTLTIKIPKA